MSPLSPASPFNRQEFIPYSHPAGYQAVSEIRASDCLDGIASPEGGYGLDRPEIHYLFYAPCPARPERYFEGTYAFRKISTAFNVHPA